MTTTAYNTILKLPVDAISYLEQCGYDTKKDPHLKKVPDDIRMKVQAELICISCKAERPLLVSASISKHGHVIRQPHFRFEDEKGRESHHPYCEHHSGFEDRIKGAAGYFSTMTGQGAVTKEMARLTSVAFNLGFISGLDIISFINWFFDLRLKDGIRVSASETQTNCYFRLEYLIESGKIIDFTDLVDVDVIKKIKEHILERKNHGSSSRSVLKKMLVKGKFFLVDVRQLKSEYESVVEVSKAICSHLKRVDFRFSDSRHSAAYALASVLLHSSGWNVEDAKNKVQSILKFKGDVVNHVNVMSLNPFKNYRESCLALCINEVAELLPEYESMWPKTKKEA